jgi:hypothetical protein
LVWTTAFAGMTGRGQTGFASLQQRYSTPLLDDEH